MEVNNSCNNSIEHSIECINNNTLTHCCNNVFYPSVVKPFGIGCYLLSSLTAVYVSTFYFVIYKTVNKHISLHGEQLTILKAIRVFDISHVYLQIIAIYLFNNFKESKIWNFARFLLHTTLLISLLLNPLITINQFIKVKYGLVYHTIVTNSKIITAILATVLSTFVAHGISFILQWEAWIYAILLSFACIVMFLFTCPLVYYANKEGPLSNNELQRLGIKAHNWKRPCVTKLLLFVILTIFISIAVFSIKYRGKKINYNGIKMALFFACTYLIVTPLVHLWTMPDLKFFILKDFSDIIRSYSKKEPITVAILPPLKMKRWESGKNLY